MKDNETRYEVYRVLGNMLKLGGIATIIYGTFKGDWETILGGSGIMYGGHLMIDTDVKRQQLRISEANAFTFKDSKGALENLVEELKKHNDNARFN